MYHDFRVIDIASDLRNKTIEINFSFDIDPDSINEKTISLVNRKTKAPMEYTFELKPQAVILTLTEWPEPNAEYIIKVSGLVNVIGDTLTEGGARRKLIFQSSLCSSVKITCPAHEESVEKLLIKWEEILNNPDEEAVNSYRIEIATDANFHYLVKELLIEDRTEALVTDLKARQYYIRGRVETEKEYGLWGESNGFIVTECGCATEDPDDGDSDIDEPIFEDVLSIITYPDNGTLSESFIIEFDGELPDDDFLDRIVVIRRDY